MEAEIEKAQLRTTRNHPSAANAVPRTNEHPQVLKSCWKRFSHKQKVKRTLTITHKEAGLRALRPSAVSTEQ